MGLLKRLVGKWRLWRGYCPECNLDAPEVDTCEVCQQYSGEPWPRRQLQIETWRRRWIRLDDQSQGHEYK